SRRRGQSLFEGESRLVNQHGGHAQKYESWRVRHLVQFNPQRFGLQRHGPDIGVAQITLGEGEGNGTAPMADLPVKH
ncbi:hypothetical protein, partial [Klebsiella variicola]|uniref:hypothetical protein n=1 Tax=Klebsiella variicola TaxID=244366 RepID=UPI0027318287